MDKWLLTGIGFVFTESDSYSGVDIDNCRDPETGRIADWASRIIRLLDSYTEISPSRTGVHIIVRGKLPAGKGNQVALHGGKLEMFSQARYFTITGVQVDCTPGEILDRQAELTALHEELFSRQHNRELNKTSTQPSSLPDSDDQLLAKALNAQNGLKFGRLWRGVWQGGAYPSQSEADLALCSHLAFWTRGKTAQIDRLFRESGLMREKWDRAGYGQRTIARALESADAHAIEERTWPETLDTTSHAETHTGGEERIPDLLNFPHTDIGNAERLECLYGRDIRFCLEAKRWFVWDGRRWSCSDSRQVKQRFKKTMREMYRQAADIPVQDDRLLAERHARKSEAAATIRAALECAEAEERIGISANKFDKNTYLLNCKNGTLDLRTGRLRPHCREDFITKLVHVDYRAGATCPRFMRFLHRILSYDGGAENESAQRLIKYLQKCFGYALTGDVSEKAVFCFFGSSGNNGKTTLLEIIRFVLAEYSTQILIDTLMAHASRESATSTSDLADLRGARFVTTSEAEEGQRLAVAKLKYLAQGMGEIKACRKYENPITFAATHKLFIDANCKPIVRGSEKAIWNRLKPIPFLVEVPKAEIDRRLLEKLKTEQEGILAWMVEGCRRWMQEELGDPPEVASASAEWRAESDTFARFLQERCVFDPKLWVGVADLGTEYRAWCDANNEEVLAKNIVSASLTSRGCATRHRNNGTVRAWIGIGLQEAAPTPKSDEVTGSDTES